MNEREEPVSRVAVENLERVDEDEDDEDEPDERPRCWIDVLCSDSSEGEPHGVAEGAEEERGDLSKRKERLEISCSSSSA